MAPENSELSKIEKLSKDTSNILYWMAESHYGGIGRCWFRDEKEQMETENERKVPND